MLRRSRIARWMIVPGVLALTAGLIAPVADWPTKRGWVEYAFGEFEKAGYTVSSAYTVVKDKSKTKFLYRDMLWSGADLMGLGVASFSHVGGTHFQNLA